MKAFAVDQNLLMSTFTVDQNLLMQAFAVDQNLLMQAFAVDQKLLMSTFSEVLLFVSPAYCCNALLSVLSSISLAIFRHFLQGPHFRGSDMSTSGHVQFDGCSHLLTAPACDCLLPLLYSAKKSYADKISIHLATWPHGSGILKKEN